MVTRTGIEPLQKRPKTVGITWFYEIRVQFRVQFCAIFCVQIEFAHGLITVQKEVAEVFCTICDVLLG